MDRSARKAPDQNKAIQTLLWAIKPLSDSGGPIPFPYMLTFLTVALEEGKSVGTYARELNVNRFLMSRHIRCIGDRARNGQAGLGLVTTRRVRQLPKSNGDLFDRQRTCYRRAGISEFKAHSPKLDH